MNTVYLKTKSKTSAHGGDIYAAMRAGQPVPLDFSANVSPLGLPDGVRRALAEHTAEFGRYPDPECRALTAALAEKHGVPPERIVCGNGSADLVFRAVRALRPPRGLVTAPAFSEYERALAEMGATVSAYPLAPPAFAVTERMAEAPFFADDARRTAAIVSPVVPALPDDTKEPPPCNTKRTSIVPFASSLVSSPDDTKRTVPFVSPKRTVPFVSPKRTVPFVSPLVFLCNPNNPTGGLAPRGVIEHILAACERSGATLMLDECFMDMVDAPSAFTAEPLLRAHENLIILKAFTKTYAMAGLRLGFALCGSAETARRIAETGPPWSVSAPAQIAGIQALGETAYLEDLRRLVKKERAKLIHGLADAGAEAPCGSANFVFFRARKNLARDLAARGILIRDCSGFTGLGDGFGDGAYFRAAVRLPDENERLLQETRAVLQGGRGRKEKEEQEEREKGSGVNQEEERKKEGESQWQKR